MKHGVGLHLKTAGTTWLEELIGLAEAGGEGLLVAKDIYSRSYERYDELCAPYATVIDIDKKLLPSPKVVTAWDSSVFVSSLRHNQKCPTYNPGFRQLLHVGYKVASEMGKHYVDLLNKYEKNVSANVTENIYKRHIEPVFLTQNKD
jgi:hypothetical protein